MCWAFFGCCEEVFSTIKAYNNTSPFARDWRDHVGLPTIDATSEMAIIDWDDETGYATGVLSVLDDGSSAGGTLGILLERDADDGGRQAESDTNVTAFVNSPNTLLRSTAIAGPDGGTWLWTLKDGTGNHIYFHDLDLIQQCNVDLPHGIGNDPFTYSVGLSESLSLIHGVGHTTAPGASEVVARKYNTAGAVADTIIRSDLTVSTAISQCAALVPHFDTSSEFLIFGTETQAGSSYRQLWVIDKAAMTESRVATRVGPLVASTERYIVHGGHTLIGRAPYINDDYAILHLQDGDSITVETNATIVCVDLTGPSEAWTLNDKDREFVAMDSTQVYTVDGSTGELSAVDLAGGTEQWTLDLSDASKLGTGNNSFLGAVLSSGNIAVWRRGTGDKGITIVSPAGSEIATVDSGNIYGIVEKDNRWIVVGVKRG